MVMVSPSIRFELSGEIYSESFPHSIALDEPDAFTALSFKESYEAAQAVGMPYYSVAVVESGNLDKKFHQIYDTSFFTTHFVNKGPSCPDPLTGQPIQKVHFFAAKCFQFDKETVCRPLNLISDNVTLSPFKVENLSDSDIQRMLLDSVNSNIFSEGSKENKSNVRRMQYIIATLIQQGQIFPHLRLYEKEIEVTRWLWSSAQGSYVGLIQLAKRCLANPIFSKEGILNILKERISARPKKENLNIKESQAVIEAIALSKKIERELTKIRAK